MSREEFYCCDAPGCSTAERSGSMDIARWVDINIEVVIDDEGHVARLEGHACSPECVGPAATAIYAGRDDDGGIR